MSPRPPNVQLPRPRRWAGWAIALSAAAHALLFLVKVQPWLPPSRLPPSIVILVPPGAEGQRAVDMRYERPGGAARKGRAAGITPRQEEQPAPTPEPERREEPPPAAPVAPEPAPAESVGRRDTTPPSRIYHIGPALGEGKLWVSPLPVSPRELERAIAKSHVELVDSAVAAIVQAYVDSMVNSPSAPGAALPSWTTQIFGKTFGIDSKYIYLGGLKIPSALLALLPIKAGGATMEFSQANRLAGIREDLAAAAQRAATLDDFKRAVRELRAERERKRELERNQRKQPDPADTTAAPKKP